jgi:SAM-dependent methyltransferase
MFYYPFDPRIHNFGNTGLLGHIHAELAPYFTNLIDLKAYSGRNIRKEITDALNPNKNRILDLCCGVGLSTANNGFGIDTSAEMITKAKKIYREQLFKSYGDNKIVDNDDFLENEVKLNRNFMIANAENVTMNDFSNFQIDFDKFDIVTCMFGFHEMPEFAHHNIIENAHKLAKKDIIIVDISPDYESNELMRSGEPYLLDYQDTIQNTLKSYDFTETIYIPKHVTIWKKSLKYFL